MNANVCLLICHLIILSQFCQLFSSSICLSKGYCSSKSGQLYFNFLSPLFPPFRQQALTETRRMGNKNFRMSVSGIMCSVAGKMSKGKVLNAQILVVSWG